MRAQRTVDVVSARHHARVLVRQAVVLQTRSARTQKSNLFFNLICWYNYYVLVKKKGLSDDSLFLFRSKSCWVEAFFFKFQEEQAFIKLEKSSYFEFLECAPFCKTEVFDQIVSIRVTRFLDDQTVRIGVKAIYLCVRKNDLSQYFIAYIIQILFAF